VRRAARSKEEGEGRCIGEGEGVSSGKFKAGDGGDGRLRRLTTTAKPAATGDYGSWQRRRNQRRRATTAAGSDGETSGDDDETNGDGGETKSGE
jgi:hypothetical protein